MVKLLIQLQFAGSDVRRTENTLDSWRIVAFNLTYFAVERSDDNHRPERTIRPHCVVLAPGYANQLAE